jgi:hypothetical protein
MDTVDRFVYAAVGLLGWLAVRFFLAGPGGPARARVPRPPAR